MKRTLARSLACALALTHLTCHQAILTADVDASIFLSANPEFIAAHGGVAVITALVMEGTGTPVPDGTVVQFFTTLGRIEEQGKTNDGVARVNLVSDSRSGRAQVSATSGVAFAEIPVDIGAVRVPATGLILAADPPFIPANSRTTHIFATVVDQFGNPIPNIPVIFRVIAPTTGTEFMQSGGAPIHTDSNGRAEDILRTQRPFGTPGSAVVQVTVLAATPISDTIGVPIQ